MTDFLNIDYPMQSGVQVLKSSPGKRTQKPPKKCALKKGKMFTNMVNILKVPVVAHTYQILAHSQHNLAQLNNCKAATF